MRKLIESTLVSLDGVFESPERWAIFDDEATQLSLQKLDNYDAFVMGRVTYERFRENWWATEPRSAPQAGRAALSASVEST